MKRIRKYRHNGEKNAKPSLRILPILMAVLLLVMIGSCKSPMGDLETTLGFNVDTDGDGVPDATLVDIDGDGIFDGADTNGDGVVDFTMDQLAVAGATVDLNGDGTCDGALIDTDGDGTCDGVDSDGDGNVDYSIDNLMTTIEGNTISDANAVAAAKESLTVLFSGSDTITSVTANLTLPTSGADGTTVTWTSSDTAVVAADGTVTRPSSTTGDVTVTLTATITMGDQTVTRTFTVTVKAAKSIYPAVSEGTAANSSDITFTTIAVSANSIVLSWDSLSNSEADYLYMTSVRGSVVTSGEADTDALTYTFSGLSANTDYTLILQTVKSDGTALLRYTLDCTTEASSTVTYTAVNTAAELEGVSSALAGNYRLMYDISLSDYDDWDPIGDDSTSFTGTFEGGFHIITSLKSKSGGLFHTLGSGSSVRNLKIQDADKEDFMGLSTGLLAATSSGSTITNCHVSGFCTNLKVSGFIYECIDSTITRCSADVDILTDINACGFIYTCSGCTISSCYFTNQVSIGSGETSGFIISCSGSSIENCYCTATVGYESNDCSGFINTCSGSTIDNCYYAGSLDGDGSIYGVTAYGLIASLDSSSSLTDSYYNTGAGTSGSNVSNVANLTSEQMKDSDNYDSSWDFDDVWAIDTAAAAPVNGGYPYLRDLGWSYE